MLRYGGRYIADEEALHQTAGQLAEARLARDESNWNALIDRYDAADKKKWKAKKDGKLFRVMDVPLVMQLLNIPYDSLHVFGSFFAHSVNPEHKAMTLDLLRQVPRQMTDPLMIVRGNKPDSYVFVVDLKDTNGATIVVPVEIEKDVKSIHATVNIINSTFGKTTGKNSDKPSLKWLEKQFNDNNILYVNKNKSTAWLQPYRNSSPAVATISNALFASIVSGVGQNVKTEVDLEAAKKENPGFYQSAWHGTGAYFSRFLLSLIGTGEGNQAHGWGLYFAEDRDTAEEYRYKLSSGGDGLIYYGETYEHINYVWTLVGDSNDAGGYIENDTGEAKALDEFYSFGNAEEAIASLQGELDEMREGLSDEELEEPEADEDYQKIQILHHRIMQMTLWLWVKKKMLTKLTYI